MRGLGWLPDPPPSEDARLRHLARIGALPPATAPAGGVSRRAWILDQHGESCTGHWQAQALWGLAGFKASPYVPWWLARETDSFGAEVQNVGVSAYAMLRATARHGAAPWETWNPTTPGFDINEPPPALARLSGQRHRLDVTPIWEGGTGAVEAACASLALGKPVGIVLEVDAGFERATAAGVIGPESGASRGKHMATLWQYRTNAAGERELLLANSWGTTWGNGGLGWICAERVASAAFLCTSELAL